MLFTYAQLSPGGKKGRKERRKPGGIGRTVASREKRGTEWRGKGLCEGAACGKRASERARGEEEREGRVKGFDVSSRFGESIAR